MTSVSYHLVSAPAPLRRETDTAFHDSLVQSILSGARQKYSLFVQMTEPLTLDQL
jgi:hypothetical protein